MDDYAVTRLKIPAMSFKVDWIWEITTAVLLATKLQLSQHKKYYLKYLGEFKKKSDSHIMPEFISNKIKKNTFQSFFPFKGKYQLFELWGVL